MFGSTPFGSSTFGSNTSAFGSTSATGFGTTGFGTGTGTSLFGAKTTATTFGGFGTPTQTGTGLFGNTGSTGIFGGTSNAFGTATNTQNTTGFGGFGTSTTGTGLFGPTTTTTNSLFSGTQSTFGSAAKPVFGSTTSTPGSLFGAPASSGTSLFGTKLSTGTGGLFNASTTGGLFGNTAKGTPNPGTPHKFAAQQSTDTLMKSGITTNISTKHQCITLMKEYDVKSLEELRMEDYQLGRKGPQATGTTAGGLFNTGGSTFGAASTGLTTGFGTSAFGTSTGTSLFGQQSQTGTSSLFGAKTTATGLFGNTSTTFSTPSAFSSTSTGLFGAKPGGLFGTTTTPAGTGLFGTTPAFGTATSGTGLFGTSTFGQTQQQGSLFGAASQPSTGLFGATPAFGATSAGTGTSLFGTSTFGQTAQPTLFGAKSSTATLGTAFGTTNTGGLFGAPNKPFGLGTTNTFGTSTGGTSLFGNTGGTGLLGNTGTGFGFGTGSALQGGTLGSTLGHTLGSTGFGITGTGLANLGQPNLGALQQQQQLQQQLQQHVFALTSSPFGDSPLFRNLTSRARTDRTSVVTSQPKQRGSNTPSHYKVSPRPSARVKPRAIGKNGFSQARLFDGLDDENDYNNETFVPRRSIKKLVLKNTSQSSRSISSELANSSKVNGKVSDFDEESERLSRRESNGSTEVLREKMFSTPKPNSSLNREDLDKDSPVVGVRFSTKTTSERVQLGREEQETDSAVVGIRQSKKTSSLDVTTSEENYDENLDEVQGPEPRDGITVVNRTNNVIDSNGCRVILTRSEYYCNPSIDELDEMINDDGEVIVSDFVVGREGYGMVKFFGNCNVTGLNLDEIVFFRRREIEVYPDSYHNKPPVGKGLNKKAEVTLYKVWPNDKTKRTPIKNPDRLKMVGWLEKLETATARLGATFVDYQAETGTWIFTVNHFTRYGLKEVQIEMEDGSVARRPLAPLIEDKEKLEKEKEEALARKLRLEEEMAIKKRMLQEKMYDEDSFVMGGSHDDSQMTDISQETFPEFQEPLYEDPASPASHHLATAMGVKSQRMQVMKASFFGETEGIADHEVDENTLSTSNLELNNRSVLSSTGIDEFHRKSSFGQRMYSPVTATVKGVPAAPLPRSVTRSFKERKTENESNRSSSQWYSLPQPVLLPSVVGSPAESPLKAAGIKTQPVVVPLSQSVTAGKQNLFADTGLTLGRSFRVGWGPAWTLVYGTTDVNVVPASTSERFGVPKNSPLLAGRQSKGKHRATSSFALTCARVGPNPAMSRNSDLSQDQLSERLNISLANCERSDDDSFPYFYPTTGVHALHQYAKAASHTKETLASGPFCESSSMFSCVLDLVVALWGNLSTHKDSLMETDEEDVDFGDYNYGLARKEALSEWLSKTALETINQEIEEIKTKDNNHLHIIFSLLTGRQITAACQVARENGDSRLAFLLAQASGTTTIRQWLLKQLEDWFEHKVDKFISDDRIKIYALLAGDMGWRDIQVCQDLDWKRAFAMHLWYDCPASALISDALESYENSFKGKSTAGVHAAEPRPAYFEEMEEPEDESDERCSWRKCRDTCYHLVKLFCKRSHRLENTLAPASYTRYQLDVSLSWHLYQILRSVGYNHLSEYYACFLNTSYAAQLESVSLWHWAVFVLLHIEDPVRREQVVRNLLVRYCILDDDNEEYSKQETFLLDDLNVPDNWIHEAKVVRARIEKRPNEEAYHLLKSGHYNLSHEVILDHLASSAIINEEYHLIKELLIEIAPRENSSLVKNWNTGGLIYLDYIKLCEKFNDIKNGGLAPTVSELEKMHPKVASLCHRISELPSKTATDKLCQSDMGTMCANFLKIIAKELALQSESLPVFTTRTNVLAPHIQKLPLPEDCCLTELRELTSHYVDELSMLQ